MVEGAYIKKTMNQRIQNCAKGKNGIMIFKYFMADYVRNIIFSEVQIC